MHRSLASGWVLVSLLCAVCAGCVTTRPRAQVVIDILAESGVRNDAQTLYVTVLGGPAANMLETSLEQAVVAPIDFPVSLTIVPAQEDTSRIYEVRVTAVARGGRIVGRQALRGRFLPATTSYLQLVLEDCCRAVAGECGAGESCRQCACRPTIVIEPETDAGPLLDAPLIATPDAHSDAGTDAAMGCATQSDCPAQACQEVSCVERACRYTSLCATGSVCCEGVCADNCDCVGKAAGDVCRAMTGDCDAPEVCDGTSGVCPTNRFRVGEICRAAAPTCDVAETCVDGIADCPSNVFAGSGELCPGGTCNGGGTCVSGCPAGEACAPPDAPCAAGACDCSTTPPRCVATSTPANAGAVCRLANGPCDVAETCSGSSAVCPADAFAPSSVVCRGASGGCDQAETCTGSSAACPSDGFLPSATVCRAAAGGCDVAELCNGLSAACPGDVRRASGDLCLSETGTGTGTGECRTSSCDGVTSACPSSDGQRCHCNGSCFQGECVPDCLGAAICCGRTCLAGRTCL